MARVIFISYRRDDSAGYARALHEALSQRFSAERVFMDVDDLRGGQAFADVIRAEVADAKVLLVLIGRRWRGEGPDGRHAVAIGGADYQAGLQHLMSALDDLPRPAPARRGWLIGGAALAGVALLAGAWALRPRPAPPPAAPTRAAINGDWAAEVVYDWDRTRVAERFHFAGEGDSLYGTASFLGQPRGVLQAKVEAQGLAFVTRTDESMNGETRTKTHHYRARLEGDTLHFVMQTEGGFQSHVPVEFVARRVAP